MTARVRFTQDELDAICSMAAIASATAAEGDYASWTDKTFIAAESAATKAAFLIGRLNDRKATRGAR